MTLSDLKQECGRLGLRKGGKEAELIARILEVTHACTRTQAPLLQCGVMRCGGLRCCAAPRCTRRTVHSTARRGGVRCNLGPADV